MKTRIIKTKFWGDEVFLSMNFITRYFFIYLISSPHVSLTNYFEIPIQYITLETGLTTTQIDQAKKELTENKRAYFYQSWVFVPNLTKHNRYHIGEKTSVAYNEELKKIPKFVIDYFNPLNDSSIMVVSIDTDTTHNTETINNKSEIRNHKEENITKEESILKMEEMRKKLKGKLKI
jgi:hypothetical protein